MKKPSLLWATFLVFVCGLCGLVAYGKQIEREMTAWWTQRNLDEARSRFSSIVKEIPMAEDYLLKDTLITLYVPDSHPNCIRGSGARIYGSNSSYDVIMAEYTKKFEAMSWIYLGSGTSGSRVNYRNRVDAMSISVFSSAEREFRQWITLDEGTETALTQWSSQYQTLYGIGFIYAEPEIDDCFF
jgi:hypothetical protein